MHPAGCWRFGGRGRKWVFSAEGGGGGGQLVASASEINNNKCWNKTKCKQLKWARARAWQCGNAAVRRAVANLQFQALQTQSEALQQQQGVVRSPTQGEPTAVARPATGKPPLLEPTDKTCDIEARNGRASTPAVWSLFVKQAKGHKLFM